MQHIRLFVFPYSFALFLRKGFVLMHTWYCICVHYWQFSPRLESEIYKHYVPWEHLINLAWYTMMAKPMKTNELYYPMIQFLIMRVLPWGTFGFKNRTPRYSLVVTELNYIRRNRKRFLKYLRLLSIIQLLNWGSYVSWYSKTQSRVLAIDAVNFSMFSAQILSFPTGSHRQRGLGTG